MYVNRWVDVVETYRNQEELDYQHVKKNSNRRFSARHTNLRWRVSDQPVMACFELENRTMSDKPQKHIKLGVSIVMGVPQ